MSSATAHDRLDRILAEKTGSHPSSLKAPEFSYEDIRRKLAVLIQEKRFLIYVFLKTAPAHGLTQQEIAAAIGTGSDKFEFHLSALCHERILLLTRDEARIARFRINPAFASAVGLFFAD
jgi:hypothetical protein